MFLASKILDLKVAQPLVQRASIFLDLNKPRKKFWSKTKLPWRSSASTPKGGPKPPDFETVAYKPLPEELTPKLWQTRGDKNRKVEMLWHVKWSMQKDARKRAVATHYGELQTRLHSLRHNGFLPLEVKQLADVEIHTLPVDSAKWRTRDRCVMTSRPRAVKKRWRVSRFMHRQMADHGQMAGTMRAFWNTTARKD